MGRSGAYVGKGVRGGCKKGRPAEVVAEGSACVGGSREEGTCRSGAFARDGMEREGDVIGVCGSMGRKRRRTEGSGGMDDAEEVGESGESVGGVRKI